MERFPDTLKIYQERVYSIRTLEFAIFNSDEFLIDILHSAGFDFDSTYENTVTRALTSALNHKNYAIANLLLVKYKVKVFPEDVEQIKEHPDAPKTLVGLMTKRLA